MVPISGLAHPCDGSATPRRATNDPAGSPCRNDVRHRLGHADVPWCPRHPGTPPHVERTRPITGAHDTSVLRRIPGFPATRVAQPASPGITVRHPAGPDAAEDPA